MSSPRHHVPKVYEVGASMRSTRAQIERLLEGVVLDDDPRPVRAAACERRGERQLRLTLTEGKYHQVKRMIAAVGNRVEALHRSRIGGAGAAGRPAPGAVALARRQPTWRRSRPEVRAERQELGDQLPGRLRLVACAANARTPAALAHENGPRVGAISSICRKVP